MVQEINAATMRQDSGVNQVNIGMEELNRFTRDNAASSEKMSATANLLKDETSNINNTINFFKT